MQISCLKDLATLRNPASPFTFLSYLHEHDRLVSFINRGSVIPTRREYADYLAWAAEKVQTAGIEVFYGEEVTALESEDGHSVHCISLKNGQTITRLAGTRIVAFGSLCMSKVS
jgi:L-ornithine N5-oxygenase